MTPKKNDTIGNNFSQPHHDPTRINIDSSNVKSNIILKQVVQT